jgi:hypothetical protein
VINQFAVENNARYLPVPNHGLTFCNIFSCDVTRAMGAEIPHWVKGTSYVILFSAAAQELSVNATVSWMIKHDTANG